MRAGTPPLVPVPLPDDEPVPASHPLLLRRAGGTDDLYTVLLHGCDERRYVGRPFGRRRKLRFSEGGIPDPA